MIQFSSLWALFLIFPLAVALFFLMQQQRKPLTFLKENMSPDKLAKFTIYQKPYRLYLHFAFIFLLGCLLIVAIAGPYKTGLVNQVKQTADVMLVIDASFSMYAHDIKRRKGEGKKVKSRFHQAKKVAADLLKALPDSRVGLISFSGQAPIHAPPTIDHLAVREHIDKLKVHFFQETGSSYKSVFESILHLFTHGKQSPQVVLISDGELPYDQDYSQELTLLKKNKITVHAIGIGSEAGSGIVIYEPDDVVKYKKKPKIAKDITTYRVDKHLEKFTSETDGEYIVLEHKEGFSKLLKRLREPTESVSLKGKGKISIAGRFIVAFFILLLIELTWFANVGAFKKMIESFEKVFSRLKGSNVALLMVICLSSMQCYGDFKQAHDLNRKGIEKSKAAKLNSAQTDFEKSLAFQVRPQIPLYNLGLNNLAKQDYSNAHKSFTEALKADPDMTEATFNDGYALFLWGDREFDRKKCEFERAQTLWALSKKRFEEAYRQSWPLTQMREKAGRNAEFLHKKLQNMKEECKKKGGGESNDKNEKNKDKNNNQDKRKKDKNKDKNNKGKGKNQNQKNKDKNKSKNQQSKSNRDQPSSLSQEDQEKIKQARKRIKQQKKNKTHRQTKIEQLRRGKGRQNVGKQIWW